MSKYKSRRVTIDWIKFDSKLEAAYYVYLKDQELFGNVKLLKLQPSYELQPAFKCWFWEKIRRISYIWDFLIEDKDWETVVVDIKWLPTETALLKRKMFKYKYPNIKLSWLCFVKKYWWWIEYDILKRLRRADKRAKKENK